MTDNVKILVMLFPKRTFVVLTSDAELSATSTSPGGFRECPYLGDLWTKIKGPDNTGVVAEGEGTLIGAHGGQGEQTTAVL